VALALLWYTAVSHLVYDNTANICIRDVAIVGTSGATTVDNPIEKSNYTVDMDYNQRFVLLLNQRTSFHKLVGIVTIWSS
jgi:hypothetical protein